MTEIHSENMGAVPIRRVKLLNWLLFLVVAVIAVGIAYAILSSGSHVTSQQRVVQIESEVKCPSCDGVSALDSNTAGAFAVRSFVEKQVKAGESNSQIINALEASYGPSILMSPPAANGGTIMVLLPFVFAAVVMGLTGFFGFRRRRHRADDPVVGDLVPELEISIKDEDAAEKGAAEVEEFLAGARQDEVSGQNSFGRIRRSWPLYLGMLLIVAGVGSAIWVLRSQDNSQKQLVATAIQAQNEAQTILKARVLANQGQDVQALQLLSSVLEVDPNQPVALTYQGWLLRQAGEKDNNSALIGQGQQFLEKAVNLDPGYPDAHVFLGFVLFQDRHDLNGAIDQFSAFLADKPSASFISATKSVIISAYKQAGRPVPPQLS
ncbi:MAG: hypothetical protein EPN30_08720 [Actinomycetota bacterium]|nr:MAG: hypothetical protein EPN30_08720 [Actinomycetota bacterium]